MDTGSSGESPKEPEVKSAEEKPRYFSNSAPEAGGRMRSTNPIRPTFPHSAGEGSGGIIKSNLDTLFVRVNNKCRNMQIHVYLL